jgi:hypothetical protein
MITKDTRSQILENVDFHYDKENERIEIGGGGKGTPQTFRVPLEHSDQCSARTYELTDD